MAMSAYCVYELSIPRGFVCSGRCVPAFVWAAYVLYGICLHNLPLVCLMVTYWLIRDVLAMYLTYAIVWYSTR